MKTKTSKLLCVVTSVIVMLAFSFMCSDIQVKAATKLSTPKIVSLKSGSIGAFTVTSGKYTKARNFYVKYSKSSSFSSSKTVTVKSVKKLSKKISGLTEGKTYYVKIRSSKLINKKRVYSSWSAKKSIKTKAAPTVYVSRVRITAYTEQSSASGVPKISLKYRTPVKNYGNSYSGEKGKWEKIKYDGKFYYTWTAAGDTGKFMDSINPSSTYLERCTNEYQKAVISKALYIFDNWKTAYKAGKLGEVNSEGKHEFDCSGFATYVHNETLTEFVPTYDIPSNLQSLKDKECIYNERYVNKFSAKKICGSTYSYSKMQPGDIIFFNDNLNDSKEIDHCGVYLGGKEFIQCTKEWDGVCIMPTTDKYAERLIKVMRFIPTQVKSQDKVMQVITSYRLPIYPEMNSKSTPLASVPKGSEVTVLFTTCDKVKYPSDRWALVQFVENGVTKTGYIYDYATKLSEPTPVEPAEPTEPGSNM